MSETLCVGVCMIDWDSGVCLGCGRTPEEIDGVPQAKPSPEASGHAPASTVPLPPAVQAVVGEGSD